MASILQKLKNHPTFLYHQEIIDLCSPLAHLNVSAFSHVRVKSNNSFTALNTNPAFVTNYMKKKYYNTDVFVGNGYCQQLNCLIWDNIEAKGQAAQMLQDAVDFQYKHIITLIKNKSTYVDYYYFGTHLNNRSINQFYINNFNLLEQFIAYFNATLQQAPHLMAAYDIEFTIGDPKPLFDENHSSIININNRQQARFLQKIRANCTHEVWSNLTARECDYIPLIIHGKTAKEIANVLNISHRTVEDYISSLKTKLQARNKSDLIAKLMTISSK